MSTLLSGSDYNQLRAFIAVAQTTNFTRAAEGLGVTPSSLSQMIRSLEESIGVQLFYRTTRKVSLTLAGENLLKRVGPAAADIADAVERARSAGERPTGTVKVVAFRSAAARFVEPILTDFLQRFPEIEVDITLDDEVTDIVTDGYDIGIRIGEVIERDLVAVHLGGELRQLAVASPDYLAKRGTPEHPRDLLRHDCIRWRWPGRVLPYAWEFFEDGKWFEIAVNGPVTVNDKEFARRAALSGIGVAFCIEDTVKEDFAKGSLISLLERWSVPFPGFYLCYVKQRQMAPAVRAFIDAVRSAA